MVEPSKDSGYTGPFATPINSFETSSGALWATNSREASASGEGSKETVPDVLHLPPPDQTTDANPGKAGGSPAPPEGAAKKRSQSALSDSSAEDAKPKKATATAPAPKAAAVASPKPKARRRPWSASSQRAGQAGGLRRPGAKPRPLAEFGAGFERSWSLAGGFGSTAGSPLGGGVGSMAGSPPQSPLSQSPGSHTDPRTVPTVSSPVARKAILCPNIGTRGFCRLPDCPYVHEIRSRRLNASPGNGRIPWEMCTPIRPCDLPECQAVPCRFLELTGSCPYGDACNYFHKSAPSSPASASSTGSPAPGSPASGSPASQGSRPGRIGGGGPKLEKAVAWKPSIARTTVGLTTLGDRGVTSGGIKRCQNWLVRHANDRDSLSMSTYR